MSDRAVTIEEFNLNIKLRRDKDEADSTAWWIITCPEDRGIFLAGPDLQAVLSDVPVARRLLDQARKAKAPPSEQGEAAICRTDETTIIHEAPEPERVEVPSMQDAQIIAEKFKALNLEPIHIVLIGTELSKIQLKRQGDL